MKFSVLIILFLAITNIYCKVRQDEGEEEGDGLDPNTLMEFRILGKGTFSIHNTEIDSSDSEVEFEGEFAQFPNYCKEQLDDFQFVSLTAKANTYLECWYDVFFDAPDLGSCAAAVENCVSALQEFEEVESDGEGEEEEGEAEPEEEEAGEEEEEEEEEGDESSSDEDPEDFEEGVFQFESTPQLEPAQAACFYHAITANLDGVKGTLASEDALEEENVDEIFKKLTFNQPLRTKVSWLEFWMFMCNADEDVLAVFDDNPLLSSSEFAEELHAKFLEQQDDGEEEEAPAKAKKVAKKAKKVMRAATKKVAAKKATKKVVKKLVKQH